MRWPALIALDVKGRWQLTDAGKKFASSRDFPSAFQGAKEYSVYYAQERLGTFPMSVSVNAGETFLFAGRSWQVLSVNAEFKRIQVLPAPAGRVARLWRKPAGAVGCNRAQDARDL